MPLTTVLRILSAKLLTLPSEFWHPAGDAARSGADALYELGESITLEPRCYRQRLVRGDPGGQLKKSHPGSSFLLQR